MMPDHRHQSWGADAIWRQLDPLLPGISVEILARTESTSTHLLERSRRLSGRRDAPITRPGELGAPGVDPDPRSPHGRRSADVQPCLLVAEHQTRGRGRLGRDWHSAPGASLTFSLSLPYAPRDWSGLSLAVGVALADALDEPAAGAMPKIGLKWPNDLWLLDDPGAGRKLGGVLIETVAVGDQRMCVIGVGLNVQPQQIGELSSGYACTQELMPALTAPQLLARVAVPLAHALVRFETEGFGAFVGAYRRRDLLLGQQVTTTAPDCPQGVADGVDARGALHVRAGERLHELVSGEISVRVRGTEAPQED